MARAEQLGVIINPMKVNTNLIRNMDLEPIVLKMEISTVEIGRMTK